MNVQAKNPAPVDWKWCLILIDAKTGAGHLLSTPLGYQLSSAVLADDPEVEWTPDLTPDEYGGDIRLTIRSIQLGGIQDAKIMRHLCRRLERARVLPWCYFGVGGHAASEVPYTWRATCSTGILRQNPANAVCSLRVDGDGQGWVMGQVVDVEAALRVAEDSGIPVKSVSRRVDGMPTAFLIEGGTLSGLEQELRERGVAVLDFSWFPLGEDEEE